MFRYDGVVFKGSFTFHALVPGSEYEVRVQARNDEGWSERSKVQNNQTGLRTALYRIVSSAAVRVLHPQL